MITMETPTHAPDHHDAFPLSPMQQGMLFHHLLEPRSGADIEQMVLRFHERVDPGAMLDAWDAVARKHEILRTSFRWDGHEPLQHVHPCTPVELTVVDQAAYTDEQAEARLHRFLRADRARGFDLGELPLSRLTLFDRGSAGCILVWSFHHIVLDGRSFPIVLRDVFAAYDTIRLDRPVDLGESIPYRTFIDWLGDRDQDAATEYWQSLLTGFRSPTQLMVERIGDVSPGESGFGEVATRLDDETTTALEGFAARMGVTLNTVLQGAWSVLLSTYSGERDVVFGTTRACRYGTVPGADSVAGVFINTLPMRIDVDPSDRLEDWLRGVRAQHVQLRSFEHTPLVDVQAQSDVPSGTRLFDTILVFESYQLDPMMRDRAGTGDRVDFELFEQTNYPLLLSVYGGTELDLRLEFDRSLFDAAVAERIVRHLSVLLATMATGEATTVGDLECLHETERHLLLQEWNQSDATAPDLDMLTCWRARVADSPDEPALVGPDETLTYTALDGRSDVLARRLCGLGLEPGAFVGILLDRSVDAIVSMLAVLKSGRAYLPLDPEYPPDRLEHMVLDSGLGAIITERRLRTTPAGTQLLDRIRHVPTVDLDEFDDFAIDVETSGPLPDVTADSPAYVIYTSGSTGVPKGVVISHRSLVNHAQAVGALYELDRSDRVLQFAALSFDVAAEEIFPTWLAGATVVLRPEDVASSFEELHRFVEEHRLTVLNLPAAYWSAWVDHLIEHPASAVPGSLRLVVTGSERVATDQLRRWQSKAGSSTRWLNAYGPTEATITASVFDPSGADPAPNATVPIGRPIANVSLHVLDARGRLTPIGVPGELHIGGAGVAIGYHDRPDLSRQQFITDPFSRRPSARLYRTGDRARWLPDGNVEFLGRVDDQVKIRGFRVELGEIEAALRSVDGVSQAAVVNRPDGARTERLEAHVVRTRSGAGPGGDELRAELQQTLPPYMVPVAFGFLDELPLTPSGKIDRAALPALATGPQPDRPSRAARTELEREMVRLWSSVLGTDIVGIDDDFFHHGGTSLTAIRLLSSISRLTGAQLKLADLFAAPTIAQMVQLAGADAATDPETTTTDRSPSWVFPIKEGGSRPPLFHLGGASVLRNLARYLPDDQPLYALLEQDLDADHFYTSVDEIVPHCLAGLRSVQPHGPYLIAGLCFGGVVALEMSRALRAEGEHVALTLMIDSFAPGAITAKRDPRSDPDTDPTQATERSDRRSGSGQKRALRPKRALRKLKERIWRASWGTLHDLHRRRGKPLPSWLRDVEEANTIASDAYRASPYDGDVTLFVATEKDDRLDHAPKNGWGPLIKGELRIHEVVGGHLSVYAEPHVADLARTLNACLDGCLDARVGAGLDDRLGIGTATRAG